MVFIKLTRKYEINEKKARKKREKRREEAEGEGRKMKENMEKGKEKGKIGFGGTPSRVSPILLGKKEEGNSG